MIAQTPKDFVTIIGTASVLYPGIVAGAVGGILALANIAPNECVQIQKLVEEGKHPEALELQKECCRLIKRSRQSMVLRD